MNIVLDAMGGDHAPAVTIAGAVMAARDFGYTMTLVGRQEVINAELARHSHSGLNLAVLHAGEVVEMHEHPANAVRSKRDNSMSAGMRLMKEGKADAFVTMGNSGAALAAALFELGRIKLDAQHQIQRPAISTILPTAKTFAFLLDVGANADCQPEYLQQFALMGDIYARRVLGIENPRVGIVSNGEEEGKGNKLVQESFPLLKRTSGLNFIGNVEGKDVFAGAADVVVTDGFTGNVLVKTAEGVGDTLLKTLRNEIMARPLAKIGALLARPAFDAVRQRMDYRTYGGAALLGVNGVVIIGHGRSDALAVRNALKVAAQAVQADIVVKIREGLAVELSPAPRSTAAPGVA